MSDTRINLEELRELATAAVETWHEGTIVSSANDEYVDNLTPETVLALVEAVEAAHRANVPDDCGCGPGCANERLLETLARFDFSVPATGSNENE